MEHFDAFIISEEEDSDESTEIQRLIDRYAAAGNQQQTSKVSRAAKKKNKSKKNSNNNVLLKERVSELMRFFEDRGLFIPSPESLSEKGKVWSNRNYGADKKRQRKNVERALLEDRIEQLELWLKEQHGITNFD